jgi:magnesium transporter
MITLYMHEPDGITAFEWDGTTPFPQGVVWIDCEAPTPAEKETLQNVLGLEIPTHEDVVKNEMLSRMYRAEMAAYMTVAVIHKSTSPHPETRPIVMILTEQVLLTLRVISPTSFLNFSQRIIGAQKDYSSGPEVLAGLLEEMVMRIGFNSEYVAKELDQISHLVFASTEIRADSSMASSLSDVLRRIGTAADLNSKVNDSLHSFGRVLAFFHEEQADNHYLTHKINILANDVQELLKQNAFQSDKATFQLDATLGMINVEQNLIMKILSVFTVVIMPPTLIGSIYGMNFQDMPELTHPWGYPMALLIMAICAVAPYLYFRYRRWL